MSRKKSSAKKAFKEKMVANSTIVMGEETPKKKEPEKVPEPVVVEEIKEEPIAVFTDDGIRRRIIIARFNFTKPLTDTEIESVTKSLKRLEKKWEGSNLELLKIGIEEINKYDLSKINELPTLIESDLVEVIEEPIPEPEPEKTLYTTWAKGINKGDKPFIPFEPHPEPHEVKWKTSSDIKYWPTLKLYSFGGAVLYKSEEEAKKGEW